MHRREQDCTDHVPRSQECSLQVAFTTYYQELAPIKPFSLAEVMGSTNVLLQQLYLVFMTCSKPKQHISIVWSAAMPPNGV